MTDKRKDCPMRHENGNCTVAGGFCTAVNNPICEALHNAFDCGYRSALRQQETAANRNGLIGPVEYGCEYCNDPHPARDCVVDGNLEQMLVGRSFSDAYVQTRRIKFCPMCGRKLLEEGPV